jgi:hypothetical protein
MVQELKKMLLLENYRAEDWTEAAGGRQNRGWESDMGEEQGEGYGKGRARDMAKAK